MQTERQSICGAKEDQLHPSNLSKALEKLNECRRHQGGGDEHMRRSGENLISSFFPISFLFMEMKAMLWHASWKFSCPKDSLFAAKEN